MCRGIASLALYKLLECGTRCIALRLIQYNANLNKIFHLGKLPVNSQIGAYYNVVRRDFGPNWQIRAQVQLVFPK